MVAVLDALGGFGFGQATLWVLDSTSVPVGSTELADGPRMAPPSATTHMASPSWRSGTAVDCLDGLDPRRGPVRAAWIERTAGPDRKSRARGEGAITFAIRVSEFMV